MVYLSPEHFGCHVDDDIFKQTLSVVSTLDCLTHMGLFESEAILVAIAAYCILLNLACG